MTDNPHHLRCKLSWSRTPSTTPCAHVMWFPPSQELRPLPRCPASPSPLLWPGSPRLSYGDRTREVPASKALLWDASTPGTGSGTFRNGQLVASSCCYFESPTKSFPWPLIGVSWVFCCETGICKFTLLSDQPQEIIFNEPPVFSHQ